jgi:pimeloyl-ACP methyl ester carboxylesterase
MTDHPVLIRTSAGVLGGVVSDGGSDPSAAAVILHGAGSTRAGTNQVWTAVARELAELGVATFRVDYPGYGESHGADPADQLAAVGDALAWFRERVSDLSLLVVGVCAGVMPAAELALHDSGVRAFAAITPPLFSAEDPPLPSRAGSLTRLRHRARRLPKRAYLRVRYGVRRSRRVRYPGMRAQAPGVLLALTERMPVWILSGEFDTMTPPVLELTPALVASGACRVDVVEGLALYSYPSPRSQEVQRERVLAWARDALASEVAR